jgi:hypothetical protein
MLSCAQFEAFMASLTITEKIIASHVADGTARAAQIVTVTPDILMLNDVSGPMAFAEFAAMGATAPAAPERVVLVADHFAPAKDIDSAKAIGTLRGFARAHGIRHFYEPGRGGIEHSLLDELGLVGMAASYLAPTAIPVPLERSTRWESALARPISPPLWRPVNCGCACRIVSA